MRCYFLIALITLFYSCKKDDSGTPNPELVPGAGTNNNVRDSLSFTINGQRYIMLESYGRGVGNTQINLKPYDDTIPGRRAAVITGGKYYYGEKDSTLYFSSFNMTSYDDRGHTTEILFTRKFATKDLQPNFHVRYPKDQSEVIKVGKQSFAEDFEKENTMDGVVLQLHLAGDLLSSTVPGFSILIQSHMKNIQQNSTFEITKVEKLRDDLFVMEAKFVMNVFDEDEKLYRVEDGYLRKLFTMSHNMGFRIN